MQKKNYFSPCGMYELIQHMWSMVWFYAKKKLFLALWNVWTYTTYEVIYDEFSMNSHIFCTFNIWIHTNMNSCYVRIHIIFAVIMYEFIHLLQCKIKAVSTREPRVRAASAQHEPQGRSPSLPPAPTRPRPAAPTVRVACGCPDS
jgi:hypothetical protein